MHYDIRNNYHFLVITNSCVAFLIGWSESGLQFENDKAVSGSTDFEETIKEIVTMVLIRNFNTVNAMSK